MTAYTLRGHSQLTSYDNASRIKFIADTAPSGVTTNYGYDDLRPADCQLLADWHI
jgi:hypothetical protein